MSATTPSIQAAPAANRAGDRADEVVIGVSGLHKRYGELEAVHGIDLQVRRGEIFAFLGPNGAGKTTTVEILEGFRGRSAGQVSVLGVDPAHADRHWRDRVGVVLQESQPEPGLRVRECLQLYAGYYTRPRQLEETIALVGLQQQAEVPAERLSGGQRRRLDVALALIGDPELLFLDEPTTGFDPSARRAAWQVVAGLRTLGKTVFLTTHYMDEAEHLADRIAVIAAGRIVAQGTPQTLGGRDRLPPRSASRCPPSSPRRRCQPTCTRGPNATATVWCSPASTRSTTFGSWPTGRWRAAWTCPTSTCADPASKTSTSTSPATTERTK